MNIRQEGQEGEQKQYELKLKLIADVGFIGFPNAGKSTLMASVNDILSFRLDRSQELFQKLHHIHLRR